MLKKIFFVLLAAFSFAPRARALDFDRGSGGLGLKNSILSMEVPAASPAAAAKTAGCRPMLMSLSAGGVREIVVMERACTPENQAVWALVIEHSPDRKIAVRVASDKYPEQRALIEKRIKNMLLEGMTQADADVVVMKVGPLLADAAAAGSAEEKAALIASATELLKNHLARP